MEAIELVLKNWGTNALVLVLQEKRGSWWYPRIVWAVLKYVRVMSLQNIEEYPHVYLKTDRYDLKVFFRK